MKFVNFANASVRRPGPASEAPYGRKEDLLPPTPAALPPPRNINWEMKELLRVMKPEPKAMFESKLLRGSQNLTTEQIKKETEDILAVLRNLHKK